MYKLPRKKLKPYEYKEIKRGLSMPDTKAIVVLMTASNRKEAARIAEMLVGARLAACVQILPGIQSIYRWDDEIKRDPEILIIAKSTQARFPAIEREVRAIHTYKTPQIVAVPVAAASGPYLDWLINTVRPQRQAKQAAAGD
jgi:periplasmic divalent cation tolerance protein